MLALLFGGAACAVVAFPVHPLFQIIGFVTIVASGWHPVRQHGLLRGRRAVRSLDVPADSNEPVCLHTATGEFRCDVRATCLQAWLVMLQGRCSGTWRRQTVLIATDSLDLELFRRLRVRLQQR